MSIDRARKTHKNSKQGVVLSALASGPKCCKEIQEATGLTQNLVSHYLAFLRLDGLVTTERQGQRVFNRLVRQPSGDPRS